MGKVVMWAINWKEVASLLASRMRIWRAVPGHRQISTKRRRRQTTKRQKQQNNELEQQNNENNYLQLQSGDFDRIIVDRGNSFRIAEFTLTTTTTNYC